jgi:hypothetical protein
MGVQHGVCRRGSQGDCRNDSGSVCGAAVPASRAGETPAPQFLCKLRNRPPWAARRRFSLLSSGTVPRPRAWAPPTVRATLSHADRPASSALRNSKTMVRPDAGAFAVERGAAKAPRSQDKRPFRPSGSDKTSLRRKGSSPPAHIYALISILRYGAQSPSVLRAVATVIQNNRPVPSGRARGVSELRPTFQQDRDRRRRDRITPRRAAPEQARNAPAGSCTATIRIALTGRWGS